jgi:hypothetical protein
MSELGQNRKAQSEQMFSDPPPIADIGEGDWHVSSAAKTGLMHRSKLRPLFDHLVGAGEQGVRHGEAEHPGGLCVDDQLEFRRLNNRQI